MSTEKEEYTERLLNESTWWKRLLDVQRPYRRHLQGLQLGLVLDIGCGIGRNLINMAGSATGIGVDHNPHSVAVAKSRGLAAFTPAEFQASSYACQQKFDSFLISHVIEHMTYPEAIALLQEYLAYLKPGGRVVLITPQEAGYKSDWTHVEFMDFHKAAGVLKACGLSVPRQYSYPFPRFIGKVFKYNEFVTIGKK